MSQRTIKICSFESCGRPHKGHGLCVGHLKMKKRGEDLRPLRRRRRADEDITSYFWNQVDKSDGCWIWTRNTDGKGYGQFYPTTKGVRAHRFAYECANGPLPSDVLLDHICRNKVCVNPAHLRPVTHAENMQKLPMRAKDNSSGYRGVSYDERYGCWYVRVTVQGKTHWRGYFSTPEEAGEVAVALRHEVFTHSTN